jgi:glycosyltransferase involved in cell wall biosynthesis
MAVAGTDAAHQTDVAAVSICIPTCNGAPYLKECLSSALGQRFGDMEVVVVDDASTDETIAVAKGFAARDKRIRIFRNPTRLGLVDNWNRSIGYCTGEWIKFLFQDDVLREDCLTEMLRAARPSRRGVPNRWVVCERRFVMEADAGQDLRDFYENGVTRLNDIFPDRGPILPREFSAAILDRGVGTNFVGEPTSVMMRRDLFSEYGRFNRDFIQLCDLEFWTRIGTREQMVYVPQSLADFRVHGRSASTRHHAQKPFQVAFLDKIILLHEYLYQPFYENFRKMPNCETVLSAVMKDAIRNLRALAPDPSGAGRADVQALGVRYPLLGRHLCEYEENS